MASTVLLRSTSFLLSLLFFLGAFSYSFSASPSSPENTTLFALLDFKARIAVDPSGTFSSWNASSHFCSWAGISCTGSHQVWVLDLEFRLLSGTLSPQIGNLQGLSRLYLSGNRLSGPLPSSLGHMKSLQTLDLSGNQLSGPLPSSLGHMESLQNLYLSSNQLSGPLPSSLGHMKSLVYLDLSRNQLSGPLPSYLGHMKNLNQHLDLSHNQLSGPLPSSLWQMESLQNLDLSHNQLSGPLPSSFGGIWSIDLSYNQLSGPLPVPLPPGFFDLLYSLNVSYNRLEGMIPMVYQKFPSDSFLGNPGVCAPFLLRRSCSYHAEIRSYHAKRNIKLDVLVVVCVVGPVISVASFCVWWYCFHRKDPGSNLVVPQLQYKAWTREEMKVATNNFDAANVIGSGSVSTCYLGVTKLADGMRVVALKRLTVNDKDDDADADAGEDDEARKSFVNEFKTISKLRHRNLVKVVGYCVEGDEIALVMEYMEGGDLDKRLHNAAKSLSWEERVSVAVDVAEGLVYLHHECEQPIIHCDLKPKNILLRSDMVATISDFGIARLLDVKERGGDMSMSKLRGSFGYIAPEYGMGLRISTKVDVYSYGMILLELVTGVRPTSLMLENKAMNLRTWVETLQASGQIREALKNYDLATFEEARELLRLGVQCTHDVAKKRPTMYIVRDFILQLRKQRLQNEHPLYSTPITT